jgi:hypothetical protein
MSSAKLASSAFNRLTGWTFRALHNNNLIMTITDQTGAVIGTAIVLFAIKKLDSDDGKVLAFDTSKFVVTNFTPTGRTQILVNSPSGDIYNDKSIDALIKVLRSNCP